MAELIVSHEGEEWRKCPDYPEYSVSNRGRVRRDAPKRGAKVGRTLSCAPGGPGYPIVRLHGIDGARAFSVHRLIALAFLGNPPEGKSQVNHKNGVKTDNRVENLEWASAQDDANHREKLGRVARGEAHGSKTHPERTVRGEMQGSARLTDESVREIRRRLQGETQRAIARRFGVAPATISDIARGRTWRHVH